jgi:acetate CoA/acetoacetate CoA-transferase alpha subunit
VLPDNTKETNMAATAAQPAESRVLKAIGVEQAAGMIPDGATLMIGGFMGVGSPHRLIAELVRQGRKDLTVICNDTSRPDNGIGLLIVARAVRTVIASHIGTNPETQKQMIAGDLEVRLVPQGTLAEQVRAGGYGLGGVLTATGIGTPVEAGKQKITVRGREYLVEEPLRADFALIAAKRCDYRGNLEYEMTARNFNPMMAMAADTVIAEPVEIVPVGMVAPDHVVTPHVVVDYIIQRNRTNGR